MNRPGNNTQIAEKTTAILREFLKLDSQRIDGSSGLKDGLGMDSVDFIDIAAEIERVFKVHIADDEAVQLVTVDDLVNLIARKVMLER